MSWFPVLTSFFLGIFLLADISAAALTPINRAGWIITADSFQAGNGPDKAIDGDATTFWHSAYSPNVAKLPHWIVVDMQSVYNIQAVTLMPRPIRNAGGRIGSHRIEVSTDNDIWTVVAVGTYDNDADLQKTTFVTRPARYVKITALTEAQNANNQWTSIAEINILQDQAAAYTAPAANKGLWQQTVDFPLIPAAVSLLPNGKVLLWAAYAKDAFGGARGFTQTGMYDPATGESTQMNVTNTGHDMFCPGISTDFDGNVVITGGSNAGKTTTYDPFGDAWISSSDMKVTRGYQASTTCSDGRIFTIGGSWSGGRGYLKNGEIHDPNANTWTMLPNALVAPMLTKDAGGAWRSDNHAWLFAWGQKTVFQAGPSIAMNWYDTTGTGSTSPAGKRLDDGDAMNGIAVMYDAVAGKILTAGGAQSYEKSNARTNAYEITLSAPKTNPTVTKTRSMAFARSFHNAVVLPDGTVFVTGGQAYALPFYDTTAAMTPELYDPSTGIWTQMNPMAIPRTYHSTAILLPDATVLNGGGGVCGACKNYGGPDSNHFDAEIFVPPYLLNADGSRRARPIITAAPDTIKIGQVMTVTTKNTVTSFSLVRMGTATHTVNTDQRRIPLVATGRKSVYMMTVPGDPGVALPGYWMLFAIDNKGTPSLGKVVKVAL